MCQYPCRNCIYFKECGDNMRVAECKGRTTKSDIKRRKALIEEGFKEQARRSFYED